MITDFHEHPYLGVAVAAARDGAAQLMRQRDAFSVREKAPKDLVTSADLASQHAIFGALRSAFPGHHMVGEEEGQDRPPREILDGSSDTPCWIVDPLDGTLNYVHHLHSFCVSIGMIQRGQLRLGVVLDPLCDQLFLAARGSGAFISRVDGSSRSRLRASRCDSLRDSLLACSFAAGVRGGDPEVRQFCRVLESCTSVRRMGSCALNLCYVAAGRLDGYWAQSVKAWDVAAGALMVEESGGVIGAINGGPLDIWQPKFVAAATESLQLQLRDKIREA